VGRVGSVGQVITSVGWVYSYYYYATFNAPSVGHKDDESQAQGRVGLDAKFQVGLDDENRPVSISQPDQRLA